MTPLLLILASLVAINPVPAKAPAPVQATLVADRSAAVPGQTLRVGVRYDLEPGWHIYWVNPGDAGLATRVQLMLPQGLTAGPLHWPLPRQFVDTSGDVRIVSFGYTHQVLLWSDVQVPQDLKPGAQVTFKVHTDWLMCKEKCIPGQVDLKLSLPVADAAQSAHAELFKTWQERVPLDGPSLPSQNRWAAAVQNTPPQRETPGRVHAEITWPAAGGTQTQPRTDFEFLPMADPSLLLSNTKVTPGPHHVVIEFTYQGVDPTKALPASLPVVIAYRDARHIRHGVALVLPLASR